MKTFDLTEPLILPNGQAWQFYESTDSDGRPLGTHAASVADLTRALINQLPLKDLTMRDAVAGKRIIETCHAANGKLELEDADYSWLMTTLENYGPQIFGINAAVLSEALGPRESRAIRRAEAKKK